MQFFRDQYYKITFHVKGTGPMDLAPIIGCDNKGNWIKNPKIHFLNQEFPNKATNIETLVDEI